MAVRVNPTDRCRRDGHLDPSSTRPQFSALCAAPSREARVQHLRCLTEVPGATGAETSDTPMSRISARQRAPECKIYIDSRIKTNGLSSDASADICMLSRIVDVT